MTKLSWRVAAVSDRGLKRRDNQDNYFISPDSKLFVVADGMGGAEKGEVASRLAVEAFENNWHQLDAVEPQRTREWLQSTVSDANLTIYSVSGDVENVRRMGTTIVAAAQCENGTVEIAHVGDSRAYLIRDKKIQRLTTDHSIVMEMVVQKRLTEEQGFNSIYRNLLTRCLGHTEEIEADAFSIEPRPGDWIILCSDGLNSVLRDHEILKIVNKCRTPEEACKNLVDKTYSREAPDNITIVAIQYE